MRPPTRSVGPVTQTDIVRFAGAGGDFNPLHHDPELAAKAGFPQPIAMGQFSAALLAAWLTDWCGPENLLAYEVRFTSPLHIGDTIELDVTGSPFSPNSHYVSRCSASDAIAAVSMLRKDAPGEASHCS